jgi:hypothetical protein
MRASWKVNLILVLNRSLSNRGYIPMNVLKAFTSIVSVCSLQVIFLSRITHNTLFYFYFYSLPQNTFFFTYRSVRYPGNTHAMKILQCQIFRFRIVQVQVILLPMVSRPVCLGVGPHLGTMTRFLFLLDICGLHVVGRPP